MLLNLEKTQHKCAKAKAGKAVGYFYQDYCCDTAPDVGTYGPAPRLLFDRKAFCLLWHLQYFAYRYPDEVPSCTMAVDSGDQTKHVLVLPPSRLATGALSYCRDQKLTE